MKLGQTEKHNPTPDVESPSGGFYVSEAEKHTTEIADGGASLYYVIRRNGQEIGRSYAGSWDDDFGDQNWDEHEITKESARERMGDEYYEWAVKNGKSVRYDEPLPSLDIKMESKTMNMPSVEAMEILAVSDRSVFESLMGHIGLTIEGRINEDPLETRCQNESISAIATEITEDHNTYIECDPRVHEYKKVAEDYGYVVGFK